jgi:hypothetical protein
LGLGLMLLASAAQGQDTSSLSPLGQAAQQRGIATCLSTIDALAKELAKTYDLGVFLFNQIDRPDTGLVSISLELTPSPSGGPVYMSANFIAKPDGGCQIMVESTISWDSPCTTVGVAYPQYRVAGHLLKDISILAAQGSERLFLMPTPRGGCVSVEKTVFF